MTVAALPRQELAASHSGRVGDQPASLRVRLCLTRHEDEFELDASETGSREPCRQKDP